MPNNNPLTVAQLREIQKYLPYGSRRAIASKFGCSDSLVGKVLRGERVNNPILMAAAEVAEKEKMRRDRVKADLQKRISNLSA